MSNNFSELKGAIVNPFQASELAKLLGVIIRWNKQSKAFLPCFFYLYLLFKYSNISLALVSGFTFSQTFSIIPFSSIK